MRYHMYSVLLTLGLTACGGSRTSSTTTTTGTTDGTGGTASTGGLGGGGGVGGASGDPWQPVREALDAAPIDELVVVIGNDDERHFEYTKGPVDTSTIFRSGSSIKWVSGAVILRLVEAGVMQLDDHPQDHLPWWTSDPSDMRSTVTVAQLLAFTSGFRGTPAGPDAPPCVLDAMTTIGACAQEIYEQEFVDPPGTSYFYGPSHHQILAAMAEEATGKAWATVFEEQVAGPANMTTTVYNTPSMSNPRVAGGAELSVADLEGFLRAMASGSLLPTTWNAMVTDRTPLGAVTITSTPITNYAWHYGLSVWRECNASTWTDACDAVDIISTTGAFGVHGWIDVPRGYHGVLGMDEGFGGSDVAIELALALRPLVEAALEASQP